jgi:hypothetical protein
MPIASEQLVKAYGNMCSIPEIGIRAHKAFTSGQLLGVVNPVVHPCASMQRGHAFDREGGEYEHPGSSSSAC